MRNHSLFPAYAKFTPVLPLSIVFLARIMYYFCENSLQNCSRKIYNSNFMIAEMKEKMKNKLVQKSKRLLSGIVATAIAASMLPTLPAMAEETTEKYPYTLFAGSSEEGAITVNAGNFCVNGNVATNGTIVSSGNMNINGTRTESAEESMIFIFDKIDDQYFSASNVEEHAEDYTLDELNININVPTEVQGEATLIGNININDALKALENVNLYGEVKNTNDSVIFSKYDDIIIDSQNVNLNGLVYAPFGSEGDVAGIYFNREFAVEANNYIENYDSSNPNDFEQAYDKN